MTWQAAPACSTPAPGTPCQCRLGRVAFRHEQVQATHQRQRGTGAIYCRRPDDLPRQTDVQRDARFRRRRAGRCGTRVVLGLHRPAMGWRQDHEGCHHRSRAPGPQRCLLSGWTWPPKRRRSLFAASFDTRGLQLKPVAWELWRARITMASNSGRETVRLASGPFGPAVGETPKGRGPGKFAKGVPLVLAAWSVFETSPLLTPGISFLHAGEHHRGFGRCLVA